jgi:hypothetical protein
MLVTHRLLMQTAQSLGRCRVDVVNIYQALNVAVNKLFLVPSVASPSQNVTALIT